MNLITKINFIFLGLFAELIHCDKVSDIIRNQGQPDEKLTKDERFKIFHQLPGADLHYQFIRLITDIDALKGEHDVKFNFGNEEIHLRLIPIDNSVPVISIGVPIFQVKSQGDSGYKYRPLAQTDERQDGRYLFEDRQNSAILLLHYANGTAYYDGVIGEGAKLKIVRSAPSRFTLDFGTGNHFIYQANSSIINNTLEQDGDFETGNLPKSLDILYPKLLIVIDYTLYRNLDESLLECMRYMTVFWNAVNLKYRAFTKPRVNIKVTGVIVSKDEKALKYIYDAIYKHNDWSMNSSKIIRGSQAHFSNEFFGLTNFDNYDAVFTMTGRIGEDRVAGRTMINGICSSSSNTAFLRDYGSYTGISIATHELGHLLGLPHDDGQCEVQINETTVTIMSAIDKLKTTAYVWSKCSLTMLEKKAKTRLVKCLKDISRTRNHN